MSFYGASSAASNSVSSEDDKDSSIASNPVPSGTYGFCRGIAVAMNGDVYTSVGLTIFKTPFGTLQTQVVHQGDMGQAALNTHGTRIAVDSANNVYIADSMHNCILKVSSKSAITLLAGSGAPGSADGAGAEASFHHPSGVAVDSAGIVYVVDTFNNRIRKVSPEGVVTTLAGSGVSLPPGSSGADGTGPDARFIFPCDLTIDNDGYLYIADSHRIRKVSPQGVVTTLSGSSGKGYKDGKSMIAQFVLISAVAVDSAGNVYAADYNMDDFRLRKVSPEGDVTTLAESLGSDVVHQIAVDGNGTLYIPQFSRVIQDASGTMTMYRTLSQAGMVNTPRLTLHLT
jgi:sugar lactone lactonase YvrE